MSKHSSFFARASVMMEKGLMFENFFHNLSMMTGQSKLERL